jgi:trans-L-3-hydroxyproline dehydratase
MKRIRTIDAEVAGEAVRLIVGGGPSVPGRTMAEKRNWLRTHGDALRRLLMLEPRGHAGMHGALLTEPVSPDSHAGLLSMHAEGFPVVSGESIIAAVTIALEHKLIEGAAGEVRIDTPAGVFRARPRLGATGLSAEARSAKADARVTSVAVTGVPSFVYSAGLQLGIGARKVTVDLAFGGQFYAIADSEAIGVPIEMANAAALVRMGREIKGAVESTVHVEHPVDGRLKDIQGTIFTGAPRSGADLRSATVLDGEVLRRSPGATGTAALMAVLDAMGLLVEGHRFAHEGVLGTTLHGSAAGRSQSGTFPAIVPVIEGSASITGFHEFVSD